MSNELNPIDLALACIVCIGYISGKLWMYYTLDSREQSSSLRSIDNKENTKKKGVIKRGPEWPE